MTLYFFFIWNFRRNIFEEEIAEENDEKFEKKLNKKQKEVEVKKDSLTDINLLSDNLRELKGGGLCAFISNLCSIMRFYWSAAPLGSPKHGTENAELHTKVHFFSKNVSAVD